MFEEYWVYRIRLLINAKWKRIYDYVYNMIQIFVKKNLLMVDCSDFYFFISLFPKILTMNMYYFYIQGGKKLWKRKHGW